MFASAVQLESGNSSSKRITVGRRAVLTTQPHNEWYAEVTQLKVALESSPDNLDLAKQFWSMISGERGFDVRDGQRVVDTFRHCAVKSDEGLAELIAAFRKLADDSGEFPSAGLLDPPLENLLRLIARQSDHPLSADSAWILRYVEIDE